MLRITAPLNQLTRMDAESISQLAQGGHVRLGQVALGALDGRAGKTGTLGQLRLGQRV
jgi:hypothetical protein